jgi:hypothetical protein
VNIPIQVLPDIWADLSMWIQRRHMIDHCAKKLSLGDTRTDAEQFVELIDLGIRNRIRFLYDQSVKASIESIPMPPTKRTPRKRREPI